MLKATVLVVLALPGGWAAWAVFNEFSGGTSLLGADPGERLLLHFGEWGLRCLLLALLLSPLRRWTGKAFWLRIRRMVGVSAFVYLSLHFLSYLWFFAEFGWPQIAEDLQSRTYITVGFAAWLILLALAVTSTNGWQRRLRRRWQSLHKWVYPATGLGLLHLLWLTRADYAEFAIYLFVFAVLIGERVLDWRRRSSGIAT